MPIAASERPILRAMCLENNLLSDLHLINVRHRDELAVEPDELGREEVACEHVRERIVQARPRARACVPEEAVVAQLVSAKHQDIVVV